ncbi:MAG: T9SS type A sorting domain-containing protein [Candidatus Cloacimonetes bacterium]|nr:T9SS type A sorting domain-containing protein [Candidatus Cloacimonadota bacterium]
MKKNILFLFLLSLLLVNLQAVWVTDGALQLTQPDGTQLDLYITGDEHHRWVHNAEGFTIIQDFNTGYWTWAMLENDNLIPSNYPVHLFTPQEIGISPRINISEARYLEKRSRMDDDNLRNESRAPSTGIIQNLVIFISFSDVGFTQSFSSYETDFASTTANSVYTYFYNASYQQLEVFSTFYPAPSGTTLVSYVDGFPRSHYTISGAGFDEIELNTRFHTMLRNAVLFIANDVDPGLIIDSDNDGDVDNVVFMIAGGPEVNYLLWPHAWVIQHATPPLINGKRVFRYNVNLEQSNGQFAQGVGVYVHELAHTFGAPDMYRYSYAGISPIDVWCLMANTHTTGQSISAHVKHKYLNWISMPTITTAGDYSLNTLSLSQTDVAYRINSTDPNQFFVVEYRRNTGTGLITDTNLPGSGMLVYKVVANINTGNRNGPPDELYVYRPGGTLDNNGAINNAFFSNQSGRTAINDGTDPSSFIYANSAGTAIGAGGLNISEIGPSGNATINFTVDFSGIPSPPTNLIGTAGHWQASLSWTAPVSVLTLGHYIVYRSTSAGGPWNPIHETSDSTTTTFQDNGLAIGTYHYRVTAVYTGPTIESIPSNTVIVTVSSQDIPISGSITHITLKDPTQGLATVTTVTPELSWTHTADWLGAPFDGYFLPPGPTSFYEIRLSLNTNFDSPIIVRAGLGTSGLPPKTFQIPIKQALNYDTNYFWRVHQFYGISHEENGVIYYEEQMNPSEIGSFRTPPYSVMPVLTWEEFGSPTPTPPVPEWRYRVRFSENPSFSAAETYYQITANNEIETINLGTTSNPLNIPTPFTGMRLNPHIDSNTLETVLKYNTTYYWQVQRAVGVNIFDNNWQQGGSFTTKPLNVVSEIWEHQTPGPPSWQIPQMYYPIGNNSLVRYTAITDEFEKFPANTKTTAWFKIDNPISEPERDVEYLEYITSDSPTDHRMRLQGLFHVLYFSTDGSTPGYTNFYITNDEIITMQFEHGSPFVFTTNVPKATITGRAVNTPVNVPVNGPTVDLDEFTIHYTSNPTSPTPGSSHKIIIKNMFNGQEEVRYAFATALTTIPFTVQYRLRLTREEINEMFYVPGKITQQQPIRISIFPADYPQYQDIDELEPIRNFDFIWLGYPTGNGFTPLQNTVSGITFNATSHSRNQQIIINSIEPNPGWVRIISNADPVGFYHNLGQGNAINIGDITDPFTNTIKAFIGPDANPSWVWATTANFNGNIDIALEAPIPAGVFTRTRIIAQSINSNYTLITPSNNLTGEPIYQYFEWTPAFDSESRGWDGITHYRFRMSTTFADFTGTFPAPNGTSIFEIETTNTSLYLGDLVDSQLYYWRVDVMSAGIATPPANMAGLPAWQFTTMPVGNTPLGITGTIQSDRTLRANVNYHFFNNPVIAPGATLTIEPAASGNKNITIAPDNTLFVQGNIVVKGVTSFPTNRSITFRPEPPTSNGTPNTWGGILFDGSIQRDPDAVDSSLNYTIIQNAINPINVTPGGTPVNINISFTDFINAHNGIVIGNNSSVVNTNFGQPPTFFGFASASTTDGAAITGGAYFDQVFIDGRFEIQAGTPPAPTNAYFLGSGIVTTNPDAQILNSTIKNVKANGIWIDTTVAGEAVIHSNTITGVGTENTRNDNAVIWANPGATVSNNRIGNWDINVYTYDLDSPKPTTITPAFNANAAERNFGYAIRNGHIIRNNTIAQNIGPGAILADEAAEVLYNRIYDNRGFAIQNGAIIQNNTIENNGSGPTHPVSAGTPIQITDAITADPEEANVSFNTITSHIGYGIRYGAVIARNTLTNLAAVTDSAFDTHYAIYATPGAVVDDNRITNPVGFGIQNGRIISNNRIVSGVPNTPSTFTREGAFGILADLGTSATTVEVLGNYILNMKGTAITNGSIIHGNEIRGGKDAILAQEDSVVDGNIMNKSTLGEAITNTSSAGFAIRGGREITLNWVEKFTLNGNGSRGDNDIISSPTMEVFNFNSLLQNRAENGSIFEVFRTDNTPLEIVGNVFTNNNYKRNTLRLQSADLHIIDNTIENNIAKNLQDEWISTTGGAIDVANVVERDAVAIYIMLHAVPAWMEGNIIQRHQGNVYGAALYIESPNLTNTIHIRNENAISDNHATGEGAMGAALYHHSGTVFLGPDINASIGEMKGNTITANSVPNIHVPLTLPYDHDTIKARYAGAAIHTLNSFTSPLGKMFIYRNIIASNHGNWAIWGAPEALLWNNLYQNTFDGEEEQYLIVTTALKAEYPTVLTQPDGTIIFDPLPNHPADLVQTNRGANFKYDHSALFGASNNFWGQRYDLAVGSTIFHQPNQQGLGQVVYQHPLLPSSHEHTPSLVSGVREVKVMADLLNLQGNSVRTLTTGIPYHAIVHATDNNIFTRDFTEVLIQNTRNDFYIDALLLETGFNTNYYETTFRLTTNDDGHCLINNILPVADEDEIVFISKLDPTKRITITVDFSNRLMVYPSISHVRDELTASEVAILPSYYFGEWADDGNEIIKRFTFTNGGGVPLRLGTGSPIFLAATHNAATGGLSVGNFSIVLSAGDGGMVIPAGGLEILPNGSFDVVVGFDPDGVGEYTVFLKVLATSPDPTTPGDTLPAGRTIKLTGKVVNTWNDASWADDPDADFFGPKVVDDILPNQMTVQARARIVNILGNHINPPINTVVGAFVNRGGREELRGWSRTYNLLGNVSIVVNTADAGEIVYFKIFVPEGTADGALLYDTPRAYDIVSVPGGSIGGGGNSRNTGPIPIIGARVITLQGHISNYDTSDWVGGYVGNDYSGPSGGLSAPSSASATIFPGFIERGDHFHWITDSTGMYRFGMWAGHGLTLNPQSQRLAFQTTNFNPFGDATNQIIPNANASQSPWDTQFSVYINDTAPIQTPHINPSTAAQYSALDFESSLRVNYLIGKIYISENNPYVNGEFTVLLGTPTGSDVPDEDVITTTDEFGYFYAPVVVGANVLGIEITTAQLAKSGYGDLQTPNYYARVVLPPADSETPMILERGIVGRDMYEDRIVTAEFLLSPDHFIERTQKLLLRPGWNLVSLNLDYPTDARDAEKVFWWENQYNLTATTPTRLFTSTTLPEDPLGNDILTGGIDDVRNATYGWQPGTASSIDIGYGINAYQSHDGGYFVHSSLNTNFYLTATSVPMFDPEIRIRGNNWNLVGYSPGRIAQTRVMVTNHPDIGVMVSDSWVYFGEEDTIGASTLRHLNPGEGYWIENTSQADSEIYIRYNTPDYNNVLKRFWLNTQGTDSRAHAFGIIDDQYLGYPMKVGAPLPINEMIVGQTYKILNPTGATPSIVATNADFYIRAGAVSGLPGEIFTVITPVAATGTTGTQARNIEEPKRIAVHVTAGTTPVATATIDFNDLAFNLYGGPKTFRVASKTVYDGLLMAALEAQGWEEFLAEVVASATVYTDATTFNTTEPYYLILSDKDLTNLDERNSASIVVYELTINNNAANYPQQTINTGLFGISLVHDANGPNRQVFDGIRVGGLDSREFVIALPLHEDFEPLLSAQLYFDSRGFGVYTALGPDIGNNALDANRIVSGGNPAEPITTIGLRDMMRLWVRPTTSGNLVSSEAYIIRFVRISKNQGFTFERVDRLAIPEPEPAPSPDLLAAVDPFGIIQVKPNSHFVIARIHANGFAIHPDYILATYVGDELRGKARMFNFNGQTWAYPLISTVDPEEVITFRIWKDGDPITYLEETIQAIPGGTTGTILNPFIIDFEDGEIGDLVDDTPIPFINELRSSYPNPFNPSTNIRFSLKEDQHASIVIYNVRGQRVVTLVDEILEKGHHHLIWEGVDGYGRQVGSGVYFIRMQTDGYTKVNRAVLLK